MATHAGTAILLVEDDRDVARILEHVLIDAGYNIEVVGTAAAAYQCISRGAILW
jgi:DNA-binding response OmpR family regulator